jgi:hypothetical protein
MLGYEHLVAGLDQEFVPADGFPQRVLVGCLVTRFGLGGGCLGVLVVEVGLPEHLGLSFPSAPGMLKRVGQASSQPDARFRSALGQRGLALLAHLGEQFPRKPALEYNRLHRDSDTGRFGQPMADARKQDGSEISGPALAGSKDPLEAAFRSDQLAELRRPLSQLKAFKEPIRAPAKKLLSGLMTRLPSTVARIASDCEAFLGGTGRDDATSHEPAAQWHERFSTLR